MDINEFFSFKTPIKLNNEILLDNNDVKDFSCDLRSLEVSGLCSLADAQKGYLSFCDREPESKLMSVTPGTVVLTSSDLVTKLAARFPDALWVPMSDPRSVFIDLASKLLSKEFIEVSNVVPRPFGIDPTVRVGNHCVIHPEVRIDEEVTIGNHCVIHRGTWIKAKSIIRDHTVVGCDGINAYRGLDGKQRGFPHLASVIIGEGTEIGAGAVIPRGILSSTVVGDQVVVGNLCNIGHGVTVGDNVWMSVGCLIGGHTNIGRKATLAMGVTIRDNVTIGQEAQVGMGSVVVRDVESGVSMFGNPARTIGNKVKAGPIR